MAAPRHRGWTAADEARAPTPLDATLEPDWLRRRRIRDGVSPQVLRQAHREEPGPVVDEPRPIPRLVLTPLDLALAALPFVVGLLLLVAGAGHGRVVL